MSVQSDKQPYQIIAFFAKDKPAYFDHANPGQTAVRLATENFGLIATDFHPVAAKAGRYDGIGKYGFMFEVYVRRESAENLAGKNHPNVLSIFE